MGLGLENLHRTCKHLHRTRSPTLQLPLREYAAPPLYSAPALTLQLTQGVMHKRRPASTGRAASHSNSAFAWEPASRVAAEEHHCARRQACCSAPEARWAGSGLVCTPVADTPVRRAMPVCRRGNSFLRACNCEMFIQTRCELGWGDRHDWMKRHE